MLSKFLSDGLLPVCFDNILSNIPTFQHSTEILLNAITNCAVYGVCVFEGNFDLKESVGPQYDQFIHLFNVCLIGADNCYESLHR